MTDRDIVERIAAIFERAVTALRVRRPNHKPPFATAIRGSGAVELMRAVRPHLGERRRRQIDIAIASWSGVPARCVGRGHDGARFTLLRDREPTRDIAWLAGLLEGEGYFGVNRSGTGTYPTITLEMTDEDVVRRAAAALGAIRVTRDEPRDGRWRTTYVATISGSAAAEWMRRLRPLMGRRRTQAIDAARAGYRPIRLVDPPACCVVPGCKKPHRSRGLCHAHYMAWSRDVAKGRPPRVTPLRERDLSCAGRRARSS
jgi:hypothetical protein